jgi:hypothetical protein
MVGVAADVVASVLCAVPPAVETLIAARLVHGRTGAVGILVAQAAGSARLARLPGRPRARLPDRPRARLPDRPRARLPDRPRAPIVILTALRALRGSYSARDVTSHGRRTRRSGHAGCEARDGAARRATVLRGARRRPVLRGRLLRYSGRRTVLAGPAAIDRPGHGGQPVRVTDWRGAFVFLVGVALLAASAAVLRENRRRQPGPPAALDVPYGSPVARTSERRAAGCCRDSGLLQGAGGQLTQVAPAPGRAPCTTGRRPANRDW